MDNNTISSCLHILLRWYYLSRNNLRKKFEVETIGKNEKSAVLRMQYDNIFENLRFRFDRRWEGKGQSNFELAKLILPKLFDIIVEALKIGENKDAEWFYTRLSLFEDIGKDDFNRSFPKNDDDRLSQLYAIYNIALTGWCIKIINFVNRQEKKTSCDKSEYVFDKNSKEAARSLLLEIANSNRWNLTAWMYFWEVANYTFKDGKWTWQRFIDEYNVNSWEYSAEHFERMNMATARCVDMHWPENGIAFLLLTSKGDSEFENPNLYPPAEIWYPKEYEKKLTKILESQWFKDIKSKIKVTTQKHVLETIVEREKEGLIHYYKELLERNIPDEVQKEFGQEIAIDLISWRENTIFKFITAEIATDEVEHEFQFLDRRYILWKKTFLSENEYQCKEDRRWICHDQVFWETMRTLAGDIDFNEKLNCPLELLLNDCEEICQKIDYAISLLWGKQIEAEFILIPRYHKLKDNLLGKDYYKHRNELVWPTQVGEYKKLAVFYWPHSNPQNIVVGQRKILFSKIQEVSTEIEFSPKEDHKSVEDFKALKIEEMREYKPQVAIQVKSHPCIVVNDIEKGCLGIKLSQELAEEISSEKQP